MSMSRICLLSAFFVAAAVCGYMAKPDVRSVWGAELHDGCKEDCTDYHIHAIVECQDLDPGCDTTICMINNIRYIECETEDEAPEANECAYGGDPNDWSRWIVVREMACSDNGDYTYTYAECVGSPYASEFTPCSVGSCFGTLVADQAEEMNRVVCTN